MKGDAQPLIKFFDGSDKRFIIPLYQRNYDWKTGAGISYESKRDIGDPVFV